MSGLPRSLSDKVKSMSSADKRNLWNKFLLPMIERSGITVKIRESTSEYLNIDLGFPEGEPDPFARFKDAVETE